ncbi:hypothetical protein [uncultured Tateyamaria sp.]|uniref:hypothetical protein n=1 Tax=uncultured Tateyamaria sp. TaxID=455651 RepID=UPI00263590D1|nr:hypothetical protein [uncultured Tateyamaria sp.]
MQRSVVSVISAVFVLSACDAPAPSKDGQSSRAQISFIDDPQLKQHSNVTLDAKTRAAFEDFKAEPNAHGAFYVPQDGRSWGWHRNTATAADAKKTAKVTCEFFAKRTCILYATWEGGPTDALDALPAQYKERLGKALRENRLGNDLALAVSPIGSYGWSWNYGFDAEAKASALKQCDESVDKQRPSFDPPQREAYEQNGVFDCRIQLFF